MRAMIKTDHRMIPLNEASHFVSILQEAHMENWRMGVYSPKEHSKVVERPQKITLRLRNPQNNLN